MSDNPTAAKRPKIEQESSQEGEKEDSTSDVDECHKIEFMRRWWEEDRATMLDLQTKGVAMYEWDFDVDPMESESINVSRLVGDYDILMVYGMGIQSAIQSDRDVLPTHQMLCRTVAPGAKVSFHAETIEPGHSYYEDEYTADCVFGHISGVQKSHTSYFDENWERIIQMDDVRLRQRVYNYSVDYFDVDYAHQHGGERGRGKSCAVLVLSNSGCLKWMPTEGSEADTIEREDEGYYDWMRKQSKEHRDWSYWKEEHSWLCRHIGLPVEAAKSIHSFNRHEMPPTEFEWKEGDILLEFFHVDNHRSVLRTIYLARPRSEELRKQLVEQANLINRQSETDPTGS